MLSEEMVDKRKRSHGSPGRSHSELKQQEKCLRAGTEGREDGSVYNGAGEGRGEQGGGREGNLRGTSYSHVRGAGLGLCV